MPDSPSQFESAPIAPERYELAAPPAYRFAVDRRDFLGLLGGGLLVVFSASAQESGRGRRSQAIPSDLNAWLHIAEDGGVTICTGKTEVGQNIRTSLSQAAAEELHCPDRFREVDHGRHLAGALRHGDFRQPDHPHHGAASPPRRRYRA